MLQPLAAITMPSYSEPCLQLGGTAQDNLGGGGLQLSDPPPPRSAHALGSVRANQTSFGEASELGDTPVVAYGKLNDEPRTTRSMHSSSVRS